MALCRGSSLFPDSGVHVSIRAKNVLVSHSTLDDPQLVNIDCMELGGHNLGGFKDYDICIRTDKHGQSIYGPSVTPLESSSRDGEHHVCLVALGGSKAMHEFLALHYMATDSAEEWDTFLDLCLPQCTWIRAGRRALALHMFDKCHVAPSHRRLAHPSWIARMKLMLDLVPAITPFRQFTCSSLCSWLLSWLLQPHLSPPPSVEHASVQVGGIF